MADSASRNLQRQLSEANQSEMIQPNQIINNELRPQIQEIGKMEDELKSATSRRNSYKYKVPVLEPRKQEQLNKYLIMQKKDEQNKQFYETETNCQKIMKQFNKINLSALYFMAMVGFQIFMLILYLVGIFITDKDQRKIGVGVLLCLTTALYCGWIYYTCWRKDFVDRYWGWAWVSLMVNTMGAAIGAASGVWYLCFIFSGVILLFDSIILSIHRKTWFTFFFIILLSFYLFTSGFQICFAISGTNSINAVLFIPYIVLFVLCLLVMAYHLVCKQQWRIKTKQQKWELICCFYIMLIFLSFGLALGIQGTYTWVELTQMINVAFIVSTTYYLLFVIQIKSKRGSSLYQKIKNIFTKKQPVNSNIVYQMAQGLLTNDDSYFNNPRKSIIGKPLAECTNCFSEQSRFYYENCKHVCVGHQCVLDWLKRSIKKCPLCREISDVLIEVKRTRQLQFEIQNKYRFPDQPVQSK